ncbi:ATP synthase F1 subunit gamma [Candidatus Woesebacteria bacterium]|nr:ATP synthase F1 subunit gamma [Candidatus Woesebacteria bacterium]
MANTRQVKQRIQTAGNISKITKAMEMVSASKMKRAQDQALSARPYAQALTDSLQTLAGSTDPSLHPLLAHHTEGTDLCIVITTDKGLSGSMNGQLIKALLEWLQKYPDGQVIMVGKKGVTFSKLSGLALYAQFMQLPEKITTADILPLSSIILDGFTNRTFKSVQLIYTDFINTLSQKVRTAEMLPLTHSMKAEDKPLKSVSGQQEYLFEPNAHTILEKLLPYYIENMLFQAFLESKASEHSARMVTMKNASENAQELVTELRLLFNKSRQASITSELLDITTATLSLE